jgi:hypothetical protein
MERCHRVRSTTRVIAVPDNHFLTERHIKLTAMKQHSAVKLWGVFTYVSSPPSTCWKTPRRNKGDFYVAS